MKRAIYLVIFFVFLIHQDLKAQQENILPINGSGTSEQNFGNDVNQVISLGTKNLTSFQRITNPALNNYIQITQIGDYNKSQVYLKASHSNLIVNQFGDKNDLNLYKSAPEINQIIQQKGNSNLVSDFSSYSNYNIDMKINQEGNNLSIFNNGTNSISKEMRINQSGNSGTIYIFNR